MKITQTERDDNFVLFLNAKVEYIVLYYWFNMFFIWFLSVIFYLTLYFDLISRISRWPKKIKDR